MGRQKATNEGFSSTSLTYALTLLRRLSARNNFYKTVPLYGSRAHIKGFHPRTAGEQLFFCALNSIVLWPRSPAVAKNGFRSSNRGIRGNVGGSDGSRIARWGGCTGWFLFRRVNIAFSRESTLKLVVFVAFAVHHLKFTLRFQNLC